MESVMAQHDRFDIFFGVGQDQVNLGALIDEYDGGITSIKGRLGSSWDNDYSSGTGRYGKSFSTSSLNSKTISVGFKIFGSIYDMSEFRRRLFKYLDCPNGPRRLVFNDEPNIYYTAITSGKVDFTENIDKMEATGTFTFDVPDGLAHALYSKTLHKDSPREVGLITYDAVNKIHDIEINNEGTVESFPKIRLSFPSENGYVGVVNQNGVLALGNYSATEQGAVEDLGGVTSYVLIDKRFQPSANTDPKYRFNGAEPLFKNISSTIKFREAPHSNTVSIEDGSVSFGSNDVGYHSEGLRWDRNSSPRPGYKWYGGATKIEIPDHISGKGAVNFRCDFNIRLWADQLGQTGFLTVCFVDKDDDLIMAYDIAKEDSHGDVTWAKFWTDKGTHMPAVKFGSNNGEPGQKNPNVAFKNGKGNAYVKKEGARLEFGYNGIPYRTTVPTAEHRECHAIIIVAGNLATNRNKPIGKLILQSLKFTKTNATRFDLVDNKYQPNTGVIVDNYEGVVRYTSDYVASPDGNRAQDHLVIGSEFFSLPSGISRLKIQYSNWVTKEPGISIEINESYG